MGLHLRQARSSPQTRRAQAALPTIEQTFAPLKRSCMAALTVAPTSSCTITSLSYRQLRKWSEGYACCARLRSRKVCL